MLRLLTVAQLAKRFKKSVSTIYNWKRKGWLPAPAKLPGQDLRWDLAVIKAWQEAGYPVQPKRNKAKT